MDAGKTAKTGWDGREVVTEATGKSITMGRKKYEFLGYDKNGSPVYQEVEVIAEKKGEKAAQEKTDSSDADQKEESNFANKNSNDSIANAEKNSKIQLDNKAVRQWYYENVSKIKEGIDPNLPMEEQARVAFEARNSLRTEARNRMLDQETRKLLDSKRPNLTIEELIESKMRRKSMTREEAIQDILETATKTNENVDRELGIGGK